MTATVDYNIIWQKLLSLANKLVNDIPWTITCPNDVIAFTEGALTFEY